MWGNWLCGKWLKTLCCQTCLVLEQSKIFDEAIRIYDISHVINQILNWWLHQATPRGGLSCVQWVPWFPSIMSSTWCSMSAFHSTLAWTIKMTVRSGKNLLEFTWFVDNWYYYVIQSVLCICIRCMVAGLPSGTEWSPQWHSVHHYEYQQARSFSPASPVQTRPDIWPVRSIVEFDNYTCVTKARLTCFMTSVLIVSNFIKFLFFSLFLL